ncbi:MAG TPA: hypothetical protein VMT19_11500 [Thermoanaerobaculaceae bacterium]|nr:hypothetical protein [Thermoanaerobaculaceae bacterium]
MRAVIALVVSALTVAAGQQGSVDSVRTGQRLSVRVGPVHLAKGERITEFTLTVVQGHIQSVASIPLDWSVWVTVDPQWKAVVSGGCQHGSGALMSTTELPSITLEVLDLSIGPPSSLSATIGTSFENSTAPGHAQITRSLKRSDLVVKVIGGA